MLEYQLRAKRDGWVENNPRRKEATAHLKKEAPKFDISVMFYWDAFWDLCSDRIELNPIPWSSMDRYCKRYGITSNNEFDSFVFFVRGLDLKYLELKNNEITKKRDMTASKMKSKGRR